jgi:CubicO group peptidase (beta-lactamase class C family)
MKFTAEMLHPQKIFTPATIDALLHDQTPTGNLNRSLGWNRTVDSGGNVVLFHTGFTGTLLAVTPKANTSFIFLSNRVHPVAGPREAWVKERDKMFATYLAEV